MPPGIEEMTREGLLEVVKEQFDKVEILESQLAKLQKLIFGSKSERFVPEVDPQQASLDFGGRTDRQPRYRLRDCGRRPPVSTPI